MKRATELLYGYVDHIYELDGVDFCAAWFPVFRALHAIPALEAKTISEVAGEVGHSHAAVSQVSKKLAEHGYVESPIATDKRRRMLRLSPSGRALAARLRDLWDLIGEVLDTRFGTVRGSLLHCIEDLEAELRSDRLATELLEKVRVRRAAATEVVPFRPEHASAFNTINAEWVNANFEMEPIDLEMLENPERMVLEPGGAILSAVLHDEVVGTCALVCSADREFELSKMGVVGTCRGLGIGRRLLHAAIAEFKRRDGERLFLESNSRLAPAITLYESAGFEHTARPGGPSPYARADVYMVYRGR